MADRHTLCPQNIEQFKQYLISKGYVLQPTKSDYEVLRATHVNRKHPIIVYQRLSSRGGGELVHYTVRDVDYNVVKGFLRSRKSNSERN